MEELGSFLFRQANKSLSSIPKDQREVISSFASKMIQPNIVFNRSATERRRLMMMERVKPVFFKVQKNEIFVRAGERITAGDMAKIDTYYGEADGRNALRFTMLLGSAAMIALLSLILFHAARSMDNRFANSDQDILFISCSHYITGSHSTFRNFCFGSGKQHIGLYPTRVMSFCHSFRHGPDTDRRFS